jgi:hypothetical protein
MRDALLECGRGAAAFNLETEGIIRKITAIAKIKSGSFAAAVHR